MVKSQHIKGSLKTTVGDVYVWDGPAGRQEHLTVGFKWVFCHWLSLAAWESSCIQCILLVHSIT